MNTDTLTPTADLAATLEPESPTAASAASWGENDSALPESSQPPLPNTSPLHLKKHRARPTPRAILYPPLEVETILAWADAHYARAGSWPTSDSGRIPEASDDTWNRIDAALIKGLRGLTGGSSLARLLAEWRGKRNRKALPALRVETILAWADAHKQRTGIWPMSNSGPVQDAPGETWTAVEMALAHGQRGMPGGSSLAKLLQAARGRKHQGMYSRLTPARILAWADAHRERTGDWPTLNSGAIYGTADETWEAVHGALNKGHRGLPGGSSLARFLDEERGRRNWMRMPALTVEQILTWADNYHARMGRWPTRSSGRVQEAPEERWSALNSALIQGNRTLPGGISLPQLLLEARSVHHHLARPSLSEAQIITWAENYHSLHAHPPRVTSGVVAEAPEETWSSLDHLLRQGNRGLTGGNSLSRLLQQAHPEWFSPLKPHALTEKENKD